MTQAEPHTHRCRPIQTTLHRLGWAATIAWCAGLVGSWHWTLELGSHFLAFYLPFVLLGAFTCRSRPRSRAIFGVAALLMSLHLGALYLPAPAPREAHTKTIRVLSFNLYLHNRTSDQAVQWAVLQHADVVFLTEVTPFMMPALQQLQQKYPYSCGQADDSPFGLMLYSRQALQECLLVYAKGNPYPYIRAQRQDGMPLYGLHPPPPLGRTLATARNDYLRHIAKQIQSENTAIVLGDLNATPWSPEFRKLLNVSGLSDGRQGIGILPSWTPRPWLPPLLPLDHVLFKTGELLSLKRGPRLGSDHSPLLALIRYEIKPQGDDAAIPGETHRPDGQ